MRLGLSDVEHLPRAIALLFDLGFAAQPIDASGVGERAWYGPERVGELSQEEGRIISARVVPAFLEREGITGDAARDLERIAAEALHRCFITHDLDPSTPAATLRRTCSGAVAAATRGQLGDERAHRLGAAIEMDLASRGTQSE